jgi:hypothetical protein
VGADGAPLLQGRSLTYRFAMLAPFWAGAVFGATPLSPGRTRRLASGVLRHFAEHGCVDERGLLPLGWHHAFPAMRQSYSGPGSPYWAAKGFAGLVLPPGDPVWTATEEPLELERHDVERVIAAPGWLVSTAGGIVRVANHGTARVPIGWLSGEHRVPAPMDDALYARHAYSTHAAPPVAGEPDVALLDEHGRPLPRGVMELLHLAPRQAVSRSEDGRLVTASVLHGPWEVRLARVEEARRLRISGFALAGEPGDGSVRRGGLVSAVFPLRGFGTAGVRPRYGSDPFGDPAFIPYVEADARPGEVYAALVTLGPEMAANVTIADGVEVRFPDGVSERVELVPQPGGDVHSRELDRLGHALRR